jgi:S-(hydroxymethyl)glutathione dehydrogenase / alcohol dehydrogenase
MTIEIPRTMKAAVLVEQRKPLVIMDIALPETLEPGQVLVKLHYSGICGSQLGEIDGVKGPDRFLPHLLGHEGSGTVVSTGPAVRHVSAGDKVVLHWRKGPGIEAAPAKYTSEAGAINAGWVTTFNEYAVVSENRLTTIPDALDLDVAALFGCAVTTGFGAVLNNANLQIGESIVIYGAGGIGLNIVQAAAMVSAYPIIAVDLHDNKLELAKELGATHVINGHSKNVSEQIQVILNEQSLDAFIDNTGNPNIIEMGYQITSSSGRVILVGVPSAGKDISIHSLPLHFGKILMGSHGGDADPAVDIPRYARMYSQGRLNLKELISKIYSLESINDAINDLRSGVLPGRILIDFA